MKWTYDAVRTTHVLEDAGTPLARIHLKRSDKGKRRFVVKTLVSFLYFSPLRQKRLERASKEWRVTRRSFDAFEAAQNHVAVKKAEVERFIRQREQA